VVNARDVLVRFMDNNTIINDVVVQVIAPAQTVSVNTTWVASYPLGWHNISVIVDPYGDIPELNKSDNTNYTWVNVRGVPDLSIDSGDISFTPTTPSTNSTAVISVIVHNIGDVTAENVNVSVYDTPPIGSQVFVGYAIIDQIHSNSSSQATIDWTPNMPGNHTLKVIVDENDLIEEVQNGNNVVNLTIYVLDYADLVPVAMIFFPASQVEVGSLLEIEVDVRNQGEATASEVRVRFWLGDPETGEIIDEVIIPQIQKDFIQPAVGVWQANTSNYQKMETRLIYVQVNPDQTVKEKDYSNDNISATISVIDYRPNFMFVTDLEIKKGETIVDNASVGETVNILTTVKNDGLVASMGVVIEIYALDNDSYITHIATVTRDIPADGSVLINVTWVVNATMGSNQIVAWVNPDRSIDERIYTNDVISIEFTVNPPEPEISINLGGITEYKPDTLVFVQGTVKNRINGEPLKDISVSVSLTRLDGTRIGDAIVTTTNDLGQFQASIYIPPGEEGNRYINAEVVLAGTPYEKNEEIHVEPIQEEAAFPWWIWLIIIAVVAAVIIGFSLYLYKYGLGKMVECGECGALIPENSKKCPKCGVEFEAGTAKCSECGAWIPASATVCPECGAKFIGEAIGEEEDEYIRKMREQYEAMLDEKKEQAKEELGNKYSESKFIAWWKKQPDYITFESWLGEQEEKRKSGAFACPVCDTLNPRGAAVCHKCGTVFETKIAEKEEPQKRPLRRIVRKPTGKKAPEPPGEEPPTEGESQESGEPEAAKEENKEANE
jgi:ribosomal protein L40E/formylmethanofuran dehydrogenase subunit D